MLRDFLHDEGFEVVEADNGRTALDAMRQHQPDVILLDLMMPEMDGWEFRAAQRADPAMANIPVVVMSGGVQPHIHASRLGALAGLSKPFPIDQLVSIIETVVPAS
jgi:two-component system response regulator MprA